eukprot:GHVL01032594.1.p1 GENE.GHVL01032594.1~~GHVL01032594.1.p1  ORF type:complete len:483 (+),score=53.90 GHVL01032594.1:184-1632(+)
MFSRRYIIKGLLALAVTFLLLQFVGFKMFLDKAEQRFDSSPWGVTKRFLETCNTLHLPVFVAEPSLLRALRTGGESALDLWNLGRYSVVTFGAIEASVNELHAVLNKMDNFLHLGITSPDPRHMSLESAQNYRTFPSHYFLWRQNSAAPVIHLVLFYRRGDYLWHAAAVNPKSIQPPINASRLTVGKHAGAMERFSILKDEVRGLEISFPDDISGFVHSLQHSKFIECDYPRARHFFMTDGKKTKQDMPEFKRTARQLLSVVTKVMDSMEVPFWISSGTCLGWYRQCDIIPYSKDVDIGIMIKDHREEMVTALEQSGLQLVQLFGKESDSLELSFMYSGVKLDIFFFYDEEYYVWNGGTQASTGKKFKYIFPKFSLAWTQFLGLKVRVPDPPLPYIEANYGENWDIPVQHWDWKKSPPNVIPNGEWPEKERDEVIQLFEIEEEKEKDNEEEKKKDNDKEKKNDEKEKKDNDKEKKDNDKERR